MNVIDSSHPARSIAPRPRASWTGPDQVAMVAARRAACVSRSFASSGTALIAASSPTVGFALISSIAWSVAATNAATASCCSSSVFVPAMSPGPGSGVIESIRRIDGLLAVQLQLDRLVVDEPGRGVDRALLDGGRLGEIGVLDDLDVVGRQAGRREQRLEHDPARAVAAGDADLLALEVGRGRDPGRRLGEDDVRELAVDRRDVGDRDAVADRRDDARPVADPDVDRALADERDEVRVDLVLELDVEAGIGVVAVLLRRGRTGRTGRSGCSRARRPAPSG